MRGNGRIFTRKNSSSLWIAYYHRGQEVRESVDKYLRGNGVIRPATPNDAERLLKLRMKHIGAEWLGLKPFVGPSQDKILVSELLDALEADLKLRQVRSLAGILSHLKQVRTAFADVRAIAVTAATVDRYIETRLSEKEPPAMATVNRETGLLAQAFKLGVERQRISAAPKIRKLPERNARQGFWEKADFNQMVKHLPKHLQGFAKFGYHSGWRKGEISSLEWADVDIAAKVLRLRPENSKTNEGRVLALEGDLLNVITEQWTQREYEKSDKTIGISLYVFHCSNGQPIGDIRKAWAAACKAAKVENKLFHDLRRTFVRNAIRAGVPERVAMAITGHKTRAIFDRYHIVNEADLRNAMQLKDEYLKTVPAQNVTAFAAQKAAGK